MGRSDAQGGKIHFFGAGFQDKMIPASDSRQFFVQGQHLAGTG